VFLLEHNGQYAGCAALALKPHETGEIKRLYVARSAQGQGYGKALMEAVIGEANRLGLHRLVLDTIAAKMPKAVAMYERRGFVETGRHQAGGHELIDMELDLR
jgi:GNAT superfamily N-acetyltransferase